MAGDKNHALRLLRVCSAHNGIHIGDLGRLGNAPCPRRAAGRVGDKGIPLYLEAAAAFARNGFELAGDPVGGGVNPLAGRQVSLHAGQCVAGTETNQRFYRLIYLGRRDGR